MGKGGKVTIGFWYSMGLHMGLASGPMDALRKITAGGKLAWSGNVTSSGDVQIQARELFGGEKKEGGVEGTLSVCMGEATQQPHPYLVAQLGTPTPAFRGLVTLVFRGLVGALNPYIKQWAFQCQRWVKGWRTPVWEPDLCQIGDGMNGAHFIYRAITDPVTGLGRDAATALDLVRMQQAAQTLHDEGLGFCFKWSRSDVTGNFIRMVCDHVGGDFVDDPTTGLQYLELYRGDYDIDAVPLLDESNVIELVSYEQAALAGSVNQVVVTYHDSETNKDGAVTVNNTANIQAQGRVISQSVRYDGVWNADLAGRLGMRDLHATSSLPARMKLKVHSNLEVRKGDVLAFSWSRLNVSRMPIRVLDIDRGTTTATAPTLTCAQDVYGLPSQAYVVQQPPLWTAPQHAPQPVVTQRLIEASYRDLAANMREADLNLVTADAGYVGALGARPAGVNYNYALTTRIGTTGDFREVAAGDFAPNALLGTALVAGAAAASVTLTGARGLDQVTVGDEALIGDELFRVDAIDAVAATATLARGCVDTVPAAHAVGDRVWFTDGFTASDPTQYITGETVQAKLLTRTGDGMLDPALAQAITVQMGARQARPYPPANLRINGTAYPTAVVEPLALTWSHRDRLLQADQLIDTAQTDIGPEPGTTYTLRVYLAGVLKSTTTGITATSAAPSVGGYGVTRVEIDAVRDGLTSRQPLVATVDYRSALAITTVSPITLPLGVATTKQMQSSGGQPPMTWTVDQLPAGCTMDASGLIASNGTATAGDTASSFTVTDSAGSVATLSGVVRVTPLHVRRMWRLKITAPQSGTLTALMELVIRAAPGGDNLCVGGSAFADSTFTASYAASNAFDGQTVDGGGSVPYPWASTSTSLPHFVGYALAAASAVTEIAIYPRSGASAQQNPMDFTVQSSVDSTTGLDGTWEDEWSITGQTNWTPGVARVFTRP